MQAETDDARRGSWPAERNDWRGVVNCDGNAAGSGGLRH